MIICLAILTPMCFASDTQSENTELPPGVVLMEGEVWIPAGSEDEIMPLGYDDDIVPHCFTYVGQIRGNYVVDLIVGSAVDSTIIASIPALSLALTGTTIVIPACVGIIYGLGSGFLSYYSTPKSQQGDYIRMIYTCRDPLAYCGFAYPYINYHLVSYYATLEDGKGGTRTVCTASKGAFEYALLP